MDVSAKPILRVGKIKSRGRVTLQSVDNHLARAVETPNADPERTASNVWLRGGPGEIRQRVERVMQRCGIDPAGLRRDATVANDVLLSVSPQWFRPGDPDKAGTWRKDRLATFKREAEAFLREQFGGALAAAVLHLDESTPHIQAVVVPVVRRGDGWKLSGKDRFNAERLRDLQGAWEARLRPHGVGPRTQNSPARHRTIRDYYKARQAAPEAPEPLPPSPPPLKALMPTQAGRAALAEWQEGETQKAKARNKALAPLVAQGVLYEAERRAADHLRGELTSERKATARLRTQLADALEQVELTKDQVARLRGLPIHEVALRLGYEGEIKPRENAIDLVKRVGSLDYQGATAWLHHQFGPDAAVTAIAENARSEIEASPPPPVFTKAEQVKARVMAQQLDALAAPAYRVTVMRQVDGRQIGQNLGKSKDGEEQTWSRNQVLRMVSRLTAENARSGNVFLTPLDDAVRHVLIDDLKAPGLNTLRAKGYQPALVLETSPGNHQVVLKVPKNLDERATNEWFKALNRELGDPKITGLTHPFRLAGFQNRKEKHRQENGHFPFVRVVEAANRMCDHARKVILEIAEQLRQLDPRDPRKPR